MSASTPVYSNRFQCKESARAQGGGSRALHSTTMVNRTCRKLVSQRSPKRSGSSRGRRPCQLSRSHSTQRTSSWRATTSALLTRLSKVNALVITPGFASLKGREEMVDRRLGVYYYYALPGKSVHIGPTFPRCEMMYMIECSSLHRGCQRQIRPYSRRTTPTSPLRSHRRRVHSACIAEGAEVVHPLGDAGVHVQLGLQGRIISV